MRARWFEGAAVPRLGAFSFGRFSIGGPGLVAARLDWRSGTRNNGGPKAERGCAEGRTLSRRRWHTRRAVFTTEPFTTEPFTTEPFTTEPHFRQRFDRAAVGDVRVAGRSSYWGQRV